MNEPGYTAPDITLIGQDHIDRYRETDGEEGYLWNGAPALLLTTTGRKSGEPRTSALIFARDGDDYLVVASMGGAPNHPSWYLNLTANPEAEIQVKADVHPGDRAHGLRRREAARSGRSSPRCGRTTTCTRPAPTARSRWSCCRRRERGGGRGARVGRARR